VRGRTRRLHVVPASSPLWRRNDDTRLCWLPPTSAAWWCVVAVARGGRAACKHVQFAEVELSSSLALLRFTLPSLERTRKGEPTRSAAGRRVSTLLNRLRGGWASSESRVAPGGGGEKETRKRVVGERRRLAPGEEYPLLVPSLLLLLPEAAASASAVASAAVQWRTRGDGTSASDDGECSMLSRRWRRWRSGQACLRRTGTGDDSDDDGDEDRVIDGMHESDGESRPSGAPKSPGRVARVAEASLESPLPAASARCGTCPRWVVH